MISPPPSPSSSSTSTEGEEVASAEFSHAPSKSSQATHSKLVSKHSVSFQEPVSTVVSQTPSVTSVPSQVQKQSLPVGSNAILPEISVLNTENTSKLLSIKALISQKSVSSSNKVLTPEKASANSLSPDAARSRDRSSQEVFLSSDVINTFEESKQDVQLETVEHEGEASKHGSSKIASELLNAEEGPSHETPDTSSKALKSHTGSKVVSIKEMESNKHSLKSISQKSHPSATSHSKSGTPKVMSSKAMMSKEKSVKEIHSKQNSEHSKTKNNILSDKSMSRGSRNTSRVMSTETHHNEVSSKSVSPSAGPSKTMSTKTQSHEAPPQTKSKENSVKEIQSKENSESSKTKTVSNDILSNKSMSRGGRSTSGAMKAVQNIEGSSKSVSPSPGPSKTMTTKAQSHETPPKTTSAKSAASKEKSSNSMHQYGSGLSAKQLSARETSSKL